MGFIYFDPTVTSLERNATATSAAAVSKTSKYEQLYSVYMLVLKI